MIMREKEQDKILGVKILIKFFWGLNKIIIFIESYTVVGELSIIG